MTTKVSDIIIPEIFNPYVTNLTVEKSALVRSGIVLNNPELNALASKGGEMITMPHFNDLGGESQVLSDIIPLTVDKITTGKDVARLQLRGNAWGANELAGALAGADPVAAIGGLVANYWIRDQQRVLIKTLAGVFGSASMSGLVHDITGETGDAAKFSTNAFLNAQFKLGDAYEYLTAIAVHSATLQRMTELDLIQTERDSAGNIVKLYRGFEVVVDDSMPYDAATGAYTSYLFGKGAIGYGVGVPNITATETDRDSLLAEDILINRQAYILHPRGIKWTETAVAGLAPTNAELATASNWVRVYDPKKIRIVAFKHKL